MEKHNTGFLDRTFKLTQNNTTVRTELIAGITTFMTMAYILVVNPLILSDSFGAGMPYGPVFTATAISAVIGTLLMAFLANYPFALASGMGLNAFFSYTVVGKMGYSWQYALTAVFIEGIIFILLSSFKVREAIFNAIPSNLKKAVSCGIGLFISLIGLINSGVVTSGKVAMIDGKETLMSGGLTIQLGNITSPTALLSIIGILITGILLSRGLKGALLYGIILTTIIGIPMGVTSLPEKLVSLPASIFGDANNAGIAFQFEWNHILSFNMLIVVFSFLFVDMFDTIGTLVGVAAKTNMLDKDGKLPRVNRALLSDAIATVAGACMGTSTVTTYVESSAGASAGGRTGLTSVFTAICFALALFFAPIFQIVPSAATAPALILVGLFMITPVREIEFGDITEGIPAFLTIIMMPFAYSIADGIVFGMISYVVLKTLTGRYREVSPTMYILAILFILKFIFL